MKKLALILCFFAIAFASLSACADIDPSIGLYDPNCNKWNGPGDPQLVFAGQQFTVTVVNGGGYFAVCNYTGQDWHTVDMKFDNSAGLVDVSQITCLSDVFASPCDITVDPNHIVDLFFGPGDPGTCPGSACGIPGHGNDHGLMVVNLNAGGCVPGGEVTCTNPPSDSWPNGLTMYGAGNSPATVPAVPEPASVLLVSTGLAGVWRYWRRRRM